MRDEQRAGVTSCWSARGEEIATSLGLLGWPGSRGAVELGVLMRGLREGDRSSQ